MHFATTRLDGYMFETTHVDTRNVSSAHTTAFGAVTIWEIRNISYPYDDSRTRNKGDDRPAWDRKRPWWQR